VHSKKEFSHPETSHQLFAELPEAARQISDARRVGAGLGGAQQGPGTESRPRGRRPPGGAEREAEATAGASKHLSRLVLDGSRKKTSLFSRIKINYHRGGSVEHLEHFSGKKSKSSKINTNF